MKESLSDQIRAGIDPDSPLSTESPGDPTNPTTAQAEAALQSQPSTEKSPVPESESGPEEKKKPEEKGEEKAPEKRRLKVKINGVEEEKDEEEVIADYQLKRASFEKFQEAKKLTEDANFVLGQIKDQPRKTLLQLFELDNGSPESALKHFRELCVEEVREMLKEEQMGEDERASVARKREMDRREEKLKAQEAQIRSQLEARLQKDAEVRLQSEISAALKGAELPENQTTLDLMIHFMRQAIEHDVEMTAADAANLVRQERESSLSGMAKTAKLDELQKLYPQFQIKEAKKKEDQPTSTAFPSTKSNGDEAAPKKGGQRGKQSAFTQVSPHRLHEILARDIPQ